MANTKKGKETSQVESAESMDVSFLDENAGQGYSEVKTSTPRIKILHFTAPQVTEGGEDYVEGARPGYFFNTATKKVYKELKVIPLMAKRAWLEWVPEDRGGGFKGRHAPNSIPINGDLYKGAMTDEGNLIQDSLEIYCLIEGEEKDGPVLISFTKGNISHGNAWIEMNKNHRLPSGKIPPIYGSVWKIWTQLNKKMVGGKPTQWYAMGVAKSTAAEWKRWINQEEFTDYVKPNLEFLEMATKFTSIGGGSSQALLSDATEEEAAF